jgi:signal peptidase II
MSEHQTGESGVFFTPTLRRGLLIASGVLILDQLTKWWILLSVMNPPQLIEIMPMFNLVLTWNRGVSFGLFAMGTDLGPWILSIVALVIVGVLLFWLRKAEGKLVPAAIGLIVGGAIGNVIDRMVHGAVVDFLDVYWGIYHWPAFNVADSGITIGAILLVVDSLFSGRAQKG